jgi:glycogen debranching enzyme
LLEHYTRDDFAIAGGRKTWMDSVRREEASVELEALRLQSYHVAAKMFSLFGGSKYNTLKKRLREKVRSAFWNGRALADGIDRENGTADHAITPNVFLAAYVYPELLTRKEWITCFDTIIPRLWLEWGGFATIDKNHHLFHAHSTGENPASYHRGDSWFYLNNLAALVLYRLNKKKYHTYIQTIVAASTQEILWRGIVGYHAELSSASVFAPQGSLAQCWSSALFLELAAEIAAQNKFFDRGKYEQHEKEDL